MWLIMSCKEKRMTFKTACHTKYQEFSRDYVVNVINIIQNAVTCIDITYINEILMTLRT